MTVKPTRFPQMSLSGYIQLSTLQNDSKCTSQREISRFSLSYRLAFFVPKKGHKNFEKHVATALKGIELAREALVSADYSMVVLDEICSTVQLGLVEEQAVLDLISHAENAKIVVLTGRNATSGLIAIADTVTEIRRIKHGYETEKKAQPGVEN